MPTPNPLHSLDLSSDPYAMDQDHKSVWFQAQFSRLTEHHYLNCPSYRNIVDKLFGGSRGGVNLSEFPFLPVSLFKTMTLKSISEEEVFKVLTSSGTTGQTVSRIYLDKETAQIQTRVLAHIVGQVVSRKRPPMLIIDSQSVLRDRTSFSARGAGILGMATFGREHFYALDDQMNLRLDELNAWLTKHSGERIFVFGFTFMVWLHLFERFKDSGIDLSRAVLLHGGGWKKLAERSVSNRIFKETLCDAFGLSQIYNFYGMVEQVGSIFMECSEGNLHDSIYSDILIRNRDNLSVCAPGEPGLIQVASLLPQSYPGHNLLTEDVGVQLGTDDCACGKKGKYFQVSGRVPKVELRGCSDVYQQ